MKNNMEEFKKIVAEYPNIFGEQTIVDDGLDEGHLCFDEIEGINGTLKFKEPKLFRLFIEMYVAIVNINNNISKECELKEFVKYIKIATKFGVKNLRQEDLPSLIFAASIIAKISKK
jgi:hypothetical protein